MRELCFLCTPPSLPSPLPRLTAVSPAVVAVVGVCLCTVGIDKNTACVAKCMADLPLRRHEHKWQGQVSFLLRDVCGMTVAERGSTARPPRWHRTAVPHPTYNDVESKCSDGDSAASGGDSDGGGPGVSPPHDDAPDAVADSDDDSDDVILAGPSTVIFAHCSASGIVALTPLLRRCVALGARVVTYFRHGSVSCRLATTLGGLLALHSRHGSVPPSPLAILRDVSSVYHSHSARGGHSHTEYSYSHGYTWQRNVDLDLDVDVGGDTDHTIGDVWSGDWSRGCEAVAGGPAADGVPRRGDRNGSRHRRAASDGVLHAPCCDTHSLQPATPPTRARDVTCCETSVPAAMPAGTSAVGRSLTLLDTNAAAAGTVVPHASTGQPAKSSQRKRRVSVPTLTLSLTGRSLRSGADRRTL